MLKKIFILILILITILSGTFFVIKLVHKNNDSINFVSNFKAESIINIEDKVYGCEISRNDNSTEIVFQDPPSVNGMKIKWENGKQKISFKDLEKNFNQLVVPQNSFLNLLVKILDSIQLIPLSTINSDGKYTTFKGKVDSTEFEFTSDNNHYLQELKIPSKKSKINFNYKDDN